MWEFQALLERVCNISMGAAWWVQLLVDMEISVLQLTVNRSLHIIKFLSQFGILFGPNMALYAPKCVGQYFTQIFQFTEEQYLIQYWFLDLC